ncbi:MAG TPA: small basic family protein [Fimbriimonadaceae bacterium]
MIILLPIVCIALGVLIPYVLHLQPAHGIEATYLAVACIAGLDTVCGGIRTGLEGKFHNDVFLTGFFSNILIAFFFAWLGDKIGLDLALAAVLVLGTRIFTNLSLIRRFLLTKWQDERQRRKLQRQSAPATTNT